MFTRTPTVQSNYLASVMQAIAAFQMIEEGLKICIGLSHQVLEQVAPSPITFKVDATKINEAPLGKLIELFSQVSTNEQLIKDLKKVRPWRNFCAHNAFSHEFLNTHGESGFDDRKESELKLVVESCQNILERIGAEIKLVQHEYRSRVKVQST